MARRKKPAFTIYVAGFVIGLILIIALSFLIYKSQYLYPVVRNIFVSIENSLIPNHYQAPNDSLSFDLVALKAQNDALQSEILLLKDQLGVETTLVEFESVIASVTARNVTYWEDKITIDKGSNSSLKEGMIVATNKGVIGILKSVGPNTSQVQLLTSDQKDIYVSIMVNNQVGILQNYNKKEGTFELQGLSDLFSIKEKDVVVTSGLGGVYPKGILVGTISKIENNRIFLRTNQDMNRLSYVYVLKGQKNG